MRCGRLRGIATRRRRPYAWGWWRVGFQHTYGARVERADFTAVPGYDGLAQEVAGRFPEYADDDGTARLWAFLLSPYDPLPRREVLMRRAMDRLEAMIGRETGRTARHEEVCDAF